MFLTEGRNEGAALGDGCEMKPVKVRVLGVSTVTHC